MKSALLISSFSPALIYVSIRGIGEGVHENYAYCFLLRMANLLTFIHNGGISKVAAPILKMVLIFLVTKVFQKGTMFR